MRACDFFRFNLDLCSGTAPVDLRFEPPDFLADAGVPLASEAGAASDSAGAAFSSGFFASVDSDALGFSVDFSSVSFFSSVAVASSEANQATQVSVRASSTRSD